ncbi:DNA/RNA helicase domain-containing protein [Nicoliella lavandulae]|uniref:DNA/RNA helicase domain-containing protein n=1 Tax=Nicoliella lavandulae TaxID=3082954 RepID=A0ABU8SKB3_9LACO
MANGFITKEFKIKKGNGELIPSHDRITSRDELKLTRGDVIYVYHGDRNIYVGQTKHFKDRHAEHLKEPNRRYLNGKYLEVMIDFGKLINQQSLDDIEKQLITYITSDYDGSRMMIDNNTSGNTSESYDNKDNVFFNVIKPFWSILYNRGYVKHESLTDIQKSILFKYSPFNALPNDKVQIINTIANQPGNYVISGLAGTGKTVILTNLAALINKKFPNAKIGIVVKSNWKKTGEKIFNAYNVDNIEVTSALSLIRSKKKYDFIIVDESHRLRRYYSKGQHTTMDIFKDKNGNYDENANELKMLGALTDNLILLYDPSQQIRPNDIPRKDYQKYIYNNGFKRFKLKSEYRINVNDDSENEYTSDDFINGILSFLQIESRPFNKALFREYLNCTEPNYDAYFGVVDSITELFDYLTYNENYDPGSQNRVMGGYTRKWVSRKNKEAYDWIESDDAKWRWNSTNEDWINKKNSRNEIGSIHAVQGIDLNYAGVIISKDITVTDDGKIIAVKDNYMDTNGKFKKMILMTKLLLILLNIFTTCF